MRKYSRRAILSLVLGLTGALLALSRGGLPLVVAIPLGFAAVCAGGLAIWSIHKGHGSLRGAGLAISGAALGAMATVGSLWLVVGMVLQELSRQQWPQPGQHNWNQTHAVFAVNSMPEESATNFTSNLPVVVLDTFGQSISKDVPTVVRAEFFNAANRRASLGAKPDYDGLGTVHLRGYTTLHLPKHSYTFHTVDNRTNQTKVSLLGLPADDDWVLYAPFEDKTMIRDVLAYELANKTGHYAPRTRYIELFVNSQAHPLSMRDYAGVYVLMEKVKRGKDRVNIAKLEPADRSEPEIGGGYIVKRDHSDRAQASFHPVTAGLSTLFIPRPKRLLPSKERGSHAISTRLSPRCTARILAIRRLAMPLISTWTRSSTPIGSMNSARTSTASATALS